MTVLAAVREFAIGSLFDHRCTSTAGGRHHDKWHDKWREKWDNQKWDEP
jgi:hypothetical protein